MKYAGKQERRLERHRMHLLASSCGGFTLLEILVALVLLSIAMVAIFQLFSANMKGLAASEDYVHAVLTAESKMRETLDEDKLEEKSWAENTEDGYRIEGVIKPVDTERTDNLPVKLLEIDLTVRWTKGEREKSLTLKTLKLIVKEV